MKKATKLLCILLLVLVTASLWTGCSSDIESGKSYFLYVYDTKTDRFVKRGPSIRFGNDLKTFSYDYGTGGLTVSGNVRHTKTPDSYIISCNEETLAIVNARYRESLIASGADADTLAFYDALAANFTSQSQYFSYKGKLFLGNSVEMYRLPERNSDSFEGLYYLESSDDPVRLVGGYLYKTDTDGKYTVKAASYTLSNGILTMISLDANGQPRYQDGMLMRKRYLMAKVTIPKGDTLIGTSMEDQINSSAFAKRVNENMSEYAGKTVAVLSEQFFAQKM